MRRPAPKNHQLQSRICLHVLLRLCCASRPPPGIQCLQPARRSITCLCFAWRLPCAATERDGTGIRTAVIEVQRSSSRRVTSCMPLSSLRCGFHVVLFSIVFGKTVNRTPELACGTFSDDEVSFAGIDQN